MNCRSLIILLSISISLLARSNTHWSLETGGVLPVKTRVTNDSYHGSFDNEWYCNIITPYQFLKTSPYVSYSAYRIYSEGGIKDVDSRVGVWQIRNLGIGLKTKVKDNTFLDFQFSKFKRAVDANAIKETPFLFSAQFKLYHTFKITSLDLNIGPNIRLLKSVEESIPYTGLAVGIGYTFGKKSQSKVGSGPSLSVKDQEKVAMIERPGETGSPEIDNFVNAAFDLNDKIVELKEKIKSVSSGLSVTNEILVAIDRHPAGAIGWATEELAKGVSNSSNDLKVGENPDNPTKLLASKLGTLKSGVIDSGDKLKSVPVDLKAIGEQAQALLSSAKELPKAAKSLGFKNAPKALKAIKATTGVLKNIPSEVTAIGDETKKIMEEIDQVLKNIQSILSAT